MKMLESMREDGSFVNFKKKEALSLEREIEKLNYVFNGIRNMDDTPRGAVYG